LTNAQPSLLPQIQLRLHLPPMTSTLWINTLELLQFYDDPNDAEQGMNAAAVNAVAGEELGLALLIDYLRSVEVDASIMPGPCSTGKRSGYRLDGWISTPETIFQVEVKNWSAHSLGGRRLPVDAGPEQSSRHRITVWQDYWTGKTFRDESAAKVLEPMLAPQGDKRIAPLIVFWDPMHPRGLPEPLFHVPLVDAAFPEVTVFSMSTYLRSLKCANLQLPLPKTLARLKILNRIFGDQLP
jgi:hypothetical protein